MSDGIILEVHGRGTLSVPMGTSYLASDAAGRLILQQLAPIHPWGRLERSFSGVRIFPIKALMTLCDVPIAGEASALPGDTLTFGEFQITVKENIPPPPALSPPVAYAPKAYEAHVRKRNWPASLACYGIFFIGFWYAFGIWGVPNLPVGPKINGKRITPVEKDEAGRDINRMVNAKGERNWDYEPTTEIGKDYRKILVDDQIVFTRNDQMMREFPFEEIYSAKSLCDPAKRMAGLAAVAKLRKGAQRDFEAYKKIDARYEVYYPLCDEVIELEDTKRWYEADRAKWRNAEMNLIESLDETLKVFNETDPRLGADGQARFGTEKRREACGTALRNLMIAAQAFHRWTTNP